MIKMKKNLTRNLILLLAIVFIAVNILLILLDKEDRIARVSYINDWSEVFKYDLFKKTNTTGIVSPVGENNVYFDEEQGIFQQFLVEEGDTINENDPLFEYKIENFTARENSLEQQVERLKTQITALEDTIAGIKAYQPPPTVGQTFDQENEIDEAPVEAPVPQPNPAIEFSKEQYVLEQEKLLAQKNAELQSVETQLSSLTESGDTVVVTSPYQGKVSTLAHDLTNPVITLKTNELRIEGKLTEKERPEIEEGMETQIKFHNQDVELTGAVSKIEDAPKNLHLNSSSEYPFYIELKDADENLLPGYHAELAITTEQKLQAPTVFEELLYGEVDNYLWIMNKHGRLVKKDVETGIEENGLQGIKKGVTAGEWIAEEPRPQFRDGSLFVTPIKADLMHWNELLSVDPGLIKQNLLRGLLHR